MSALKLSRTGQIVRPEEEEQRDLFDWRDKMQHQIPALKVLFAVPNGGLRHKIVAAKLKAQGVLPGVLDVMLPVPRERYHGLWIELKTGDNRLSPEQEWFREQMLRNGYAVHVCYTWQAAAGRILDYLA